MDDDRLAMLRARTAELIARADATLAAERAEGALWRVPAPPASAAVASVVGSGW